MASTRGLKARYGRGGPVCTSHEPIGPRRGDSPVDFAANANDSKARRKASRAKRALQSWAADVSLLKATQRPAKRSETPNSEEPERGRSASSSPPAKKPPPAATPAPQET